MRGSQKGMTVSKIIKIRTDIVIAFYFLGIVKPLGITHEISLFLQFLYRRIRIMILSASLCLLSTYKSQKLKSVKPQKKARFDETKYLKPTDFGGSVRLCDSKPKSFSLQE